MLVSIGGINGVGKSTIHKKLLSKLGNSEKVYQLFNLDWVKFPTDSTIRGNLYKMIEEKSPRLNEEFALNRFIWFFKNYGKSSETKKSLIICDRYLESSFAFNSGGTFADLRKLEDMEYRILDNPRPNLEFIIDVNPEEAKHRIQLRGNDLRFNEKDWTIQEEAYRKYLEYQRIVSHPCYLIKNEEGRSEEAVDKVYQLIMEHIGEKYEHLR